MLGIGSLGTLHAGELALWVNNILFLFPGNISQPLLSLVSCRQFVLCFFTCGLDGTFEIVLLRDDGLLFCVLYVYSLIGLAIVFTESICCFVAWKNAMYGRLGIDKSFALRNTTSSIVI